MAENDEDAIQAEEDLEVSGESEGGGGGGRRMVLLMLIIALVIVGLAGGAYFTGLLDPLVKMITGDKVTEETDGGTPPPTGGAAAVGEAVFYDMPEMVVNLNAASRKQEFLKIRVSLELVSQEDIPRLESVIPRVKDNFQVYLRELRVEDLQGAAGMYRLREELLRRVNEAARPARVRDVLFQEMLVQ